MTDDGGARAASKQSSGRSQTEFGNEGRTCPDGTVDDTSTTDEERFMSADIETLMAVTRAFEAGDAAEFARLIGPHPGLLRDTDGTDQWMWRAAMHGRLPMLQTLVSLGLDVNESPDVFDAENPFCQVEGPILQAAGDGHLEVVRWLLERGAKINFMVNGKNRCLPLLRAATNGHLEVVKLLVENGADIHFTHNGHTPLSQAVNYGHPDIAEYLRSVGATK
jgi:uncharacterized protein